MRIAAARRRDRVTPESKPGGPLPSAHLTERHVTAVAQMFLHGPLTVGELAERLHVTDATASIVATDLEIAGLITRQRDPVDGRRVILTLDQQIGNHVLSRRVVPMYRTLNQLTAAERQAFVKAMDIFAEELERRGTDLEQSEAFE
jgi:DNA-binding MarR family transcriptional regulator